MYICKKTGAMEWCHCSECKSNIWMQVFVYNDKGHAMKALSCVRCSQMVLTDFLLEDTTEQPP